EVLVRARGQGRSIHGDAALQALRPRHPPLRHRALLLPPLPPRAASSGSWDEQVPVDGRSWDKGTDTNLDACGVDVDPRRGAGARRRRQRQRLPSSGRSVGYGVSLV
ncbi:unnamed protein product, partial [Urochloa humidicola]